MLINDIIQMFAGIKASGFVKVQSAIKILPKKESDSFFIIFSFIDRFGEYHEVYMNPPDNEDWFSFGENIMKRVLEEKTRRDNYKKKQGYKDIFEQISEEFYE